MGDSVTLWAVCGCICSFFIPMNTHANPFHIGKYGGLIGSGALIGLRSPSIGTLQDWSIPVEFTIAWHAGGSASGV